MRVESLQLSNFKSYQDATVDLTAVQLASVVGPNGAGKSSLLEAITFALTGARGLRNLDSFIRQGAEECRVSLVFAMGGQRYRLTRTRSSRNSGKSTVELVREENGLWVAEGTGAREIDGRISEILAIDEDILMLTSIVAQGDAGSFFSLRPAQRLEALGQILKLDDQYGPVERHFKAAAEAAKSELDEARREMARLENDAATLVDREMALISAKDNLTEKQASLQEAEQALQEARDAARAAEREAEAAKGAGERLVSLRKRERGMETRRDGLVEERDRLKARIANRPALEQQLAQRKDVETAIDQLSEAERADAETRQKRSVLDTMLRSEKELLRGVNDQGVPKKTELEKLQGARSNLADRIAGIEAAEVPTCDRCGQAIADEAKDRTLVQLRSELGDATERFVALSNELESLRDMATTYLNRIKAIEEDLSTLPPLTYDLAEHRRLKGILEELNGIPAKLAEIRTLEERLEVCQHERDDAIGALMDPTFAAELQEAAAAAEQAESKLETLRVAKLSETQAIAAESTARSRVSEIERTVAGHESAIALLAPGRDKLQEATKRARELETEQADADLLRKAFSKWGIPALIVGNVLLALEREVNELLALYDGGLAVRFESEKETKDGSRDSLEIMVYDGNAWREFETFSGGEKYRVASAMRLGLALLLSHRAGARVQTLILDEPEGLDLEGRLHLVKILERLSEHFGIVLVLSHYDDLKEALPSQVRVTRNGSGCSEVEVLA